MSNRYKKMRDLKNVAGGNMSFNGPVNVSGNADLSDSSITSATDNSVKSQSTISSTNITKTKISIF